MKILKIEHRRCSEFDKYAYYVVLDNKTEADVREAVENAEDAYLRAFEAAKANTVKVFRPQLNVMLLSDDTLTVGELKRRVVEYDRIDAENRRLASELAGSFHGYLEKYGIIPLANYVGNDMIETTADWGHRHGDDLDY
jgi:hypothetical protein